jgi:hypothetical protein
MKTLTNIQMSLKAIPESMFWLTDVFWKNTSGFQEAVCTANWISESHFKRLLAGFSQPNVTVKILSASSASHLKGFQTHNWLSGIW